jgi:phosphoribosylglycinamide formyltransferase-1
MRYSFYVSGQATRLRFFLRENKDNTSDISFVLTDNIHNEDLQFLCTQFHIPLYQYSYKVLNLIQGKQNQFISDMLLKLLDDTNTDYCFIFGGRILVGNVIEKYRNRLINFHPSLLPAYKGIKAIDQALADRALLLGNTMHFINKDLDAGQIIMQSIIPSKEFINYNSVLNLQLPMLKQIIYWLKNKRMVFEQDKPLIKGGLYRLDTFIPNLEENEFYKDVPHDF